MTNYVNTPQGYIGFPDDMDEASITKALDDHFKPKGEALGPFGAAKQNIAADVETIYGRGALALGAGETAKRNIDSAEARRKDVGERYTPKVADWRDIKGLDDAGQFAYEQLAGMAPYMGATIAGAGVGAMAAPALGAGALGTAGAAMLGGTLAGTAPFAGQMIKEQMDEGKKFEDTNLPLAVGAGAGAALLDTVLGRVLPGVGKAASGGILLRFAKKGLEGGGIEAGTEWLQEAITIGQANPEKLFAMPPEVQKRLIDAAVIGGMFGGTVGGISGTIQGRPQAESSPTEEQPLGPPAPPEAPFYPNRTDLPGPFEPDPNVPFPKETNPGQKVFRSVQQQLLAARQEQIADGGKPSDNPVQINYKARLWKERYETLAEMKGTDPYTEYKNENVSIEYLSDPKAAKAKVEPETNSEPVPEDEEASSKDEEYDSVAKQSNYIFSVEFLKAKKAGKSFEEASQIAKEKAKVAVEGQTFEQAVIADPVVRDANFKSWAKGAPLVENAAGYRGGPVVFKGYHGTTHTDIESVDPTYGDNTGSMGQGFYVTTNPEDASANYANIHGPDLTVRIDRLSEKIQEETGEDGLSAWETAKNKLVGQSEGNVMPVYVRMNNPMDLRHEGTSFSGRDYMQLIKAINEEADAHPDADVAGPVAILNDQYQDKGQVSARYAYDVLKKFGHVNAAGGDAGYGQLFQNVAKKLGYDGMVEPAGMRFPSMDGMTKDTLHVLPFSDKQVKGQFNRGTFDETGRLMHQGPQGSITILPNSTVIRLHKAANASTFVHESAHHWLNGLVRNAPHHRQIAFDVQAIRDWTGNKGEPFTEAQHEMFARGFEQYMRTGKSPTKAMADLFRQFAEWLTKIYRQAMDIKTPDGKSVVVPPHIQKVYDRLFAISKDEAVEGRSPPVGDADPLPGTGTSQTFNQSPMEDKTSSYAAVQQAAKKGVFTRKLKAFFDPFSEIRDENNYRDARSLMQGGTGAGKEQGENALKLFKGMTVAQKDAVNTYFETATADPSVIPAPVRDKVVALKKYINGELKQRLIDSNLLPEFIKDKNVDSYLPTLYLKYLLDPTFKGGARLTRNYARKKGDLSIDEMVAMGEVKDPGVRAYHALFRTLRDLSVMDFLTKVANNPKWVLPRSLMEFNGQKVTPHWLKEEADEIMQSRIHAEESPARKQAMKEQATRMREAADAALAELKVEPFDAGEYKAIPNTKDYGPLRGMIVQTQIADDIMGTTNFVNPNNAYDAWLGDKNSKLTRGISHWKALKVPMNLPSQVRNIASNLILLNLSGVRIDKVGPRMFQAMQDMRRNGKYYQIAKKYGIGEGTFSEQELYGISDDLARLEINKQSGFAGWRTIARAYLRFEKGATNIHGKMEVWGKVAKIIDAMETKTKKYPNGMPENDAVREANEALFDYSEAHPVIKRLRQAPLGAPFATFSYKILPLLYKTMKDRPTVLLPYIAMAATIPALVASYNDIDEDDAEKLRKALAPPLRRKADMLLLPFKNDAGNWMFVDIGYFLPWQMPKEVGDNLISAGYRAATGEGRKATKDTAEAFRATGALSNPVISILAALTTGVDPFTDRPIADKRDPAEKQVTDVLAYASGLVLPSLLANYGALGMLLKKEGGTGMDRYGEMAPGYGQIGARALGVNTYAVDLDAQRARNLQIMQRELQEVKSRMTSTLKDQSLTPAQRRRVVENFTGELKEKAGELQKYARETTSSPRLQAATARP